MNVAVITGAGRGLGRALAVTLARRGWTVVVTARDADALAHLAATEPGVVAVPGDVRDPRHAERLAAVVGEVGGAALLIHNAATLGPTPLPHVLDLTPEELQDVLDVNVVGALRMIRAVVGGMVLRGRGVVVQVTSDAADGGWPGWGAYGASKAAAALLVRTLGEELAGTGVVIRVHDPGEMDTAMHAAALPDADRASLTSPEQAAHTLLAALRIA